MSFLAIAAITSVVLTAATAVSVLIGKAAQVHPAFPPPEGYLLAAGALTLLTGASYVTTAIGAAVRYL